jgi:hypothetical protein
VARVDIAILREIVRVVSTRGEVPEFVELSKKRFQVTYLDDHKQRIVEALRRGDRDRLNMLYGQLESKVKYQVVRGVVAARSVDAAVAARPAPRPVARPVAAPAAAKPASNSAPKVAAKAAKKKAGTPPTVPVAAAKVDKAVAKPVASRPLPSRPAAKTLASKAPAAPARKVAARNPAKKKK